VDVQVDEADKEVGVPRDEVSPPLAGHRPGRHPAAARSAPGPVHRIALAALAVAAVALTVASFVVVRQHWLERYPGEAGWWAGSWTIFGAAWASVLGGQLVGIALWWRAPRNPTGRWLWLAGATLGLWLLGTYLPRAGASLLMFAVLAVRPALAMAILGWPTGRPSAVARRWVAGVTAGATVLTVGVTLFAVGDTPVGWPTDVLARFDVWWVGAYVVPLVTAVAFGIPAILVIVVLVRRHQGAPQPLRRLIDPVVVVGVLVAATDLSMIAFAVLGESLLYDSVRGRSSVIGVVHLTINYGQVALAAIGLLVAAGRRARAVGVGSDHLEIDVDAPAASDPTTLVRRLLSSPGASVAHPPLPAAIGVEGTQVEVGDRRGDVVVTIDLAPDEAVAEPLLALARASLAALAANERAEADARSRHAQLVELQHRLLDATDADRARLEADLHDGTQQRLVGAMLAAQLAARTGDPTAMATVRDSVRAAIGEIQHLIDDDRLVVLDGGLGAGLASLAASTPVAATLTMHGDVGGDDPAARHAWLFAAEAVANTAKHARAERIWISCDADRTRIRVGIRDDGVGGVTSVPGALARRATDAGASAWVEHLDEPGTSVVVEIPRGVPPIGEPAPRRGRR
jgi:signal transduction histidine kinase